MSDGDHERELEREHGRGASAAPDGGRGEPVERFAPTSGQVTGYASLAVIAAVVVYLAVEERTLTGLRAGAGLLFFAAVVWSMLIRPRVTAYRDELHIRNSVRDVIVPMAVVDSVVVTRFLTVVAGSERHVCTGVGESRSDRRRSGDDAAPSYAEFVESRILGLAQEARQRTEGVGTADLDAVRVWAWPEVAALLATGGAFLASLFLG